MFIIESNFPAPDLVSGDARGRGAKYPFRKMEIGESFFSKENSIRRISNAASNYGIRHRKKFTCRTVDGGVRVWRVA